MGTAQPYHFSAVCVRLYDAARSLRFLSALSLGLALLCWATGAQSTTRNPVGDYYGTGQSDIAVWRQSTGTWFILPPSGSQSAQIIQQWGMAEDIPVPGDYDGDGKTDFAVWRPSTGTWYIIPSSNPGTPIVQQWGTSGDIPVPGDYDGDGKADIAVWRPSSGTWYIIPSSNPGTPIVQQWGTSGDIPVAGDYDGDGKTDFTVWRPSSGTWYIIPSSNPGTPIIQQWGTAGDIPVPGDYDGDGKTDFAVWRHTNGTWYIIPSGNPGTPIVDQWGTNGDIPVPGDYDGALSASGNPITDIGVFRPSSGTWYIINSQGQQIVQQWGTSSDEPSEEPAGQLNKTTESAPVIISAAGTTFTTGTAGSFTVTATGLPTPSFSDNNATLPSGVTFTDNHNGTATLAGTVPPRSGGVFSISITASNGVGTAPTQNFTLTVDDAPAFTSANGITFTTDNTNTFSITTTGYPAPTISDNSASVPAGVTFTNNGNGTATLNSTAALSATGTYNVSLTASNGIGTAGSQAFTLTVIAGYPEVSLAITAPGAFANQSTAVFIPISVKNDQAGDLLSATETIGGVACTTSTCGSFGSITGSISGLTGSYTLPYTPPTSVAAETTITITVSSSLASSFAATANLNLYPQGATVVTVNSPGTVFPGSAAVNLNAFVYNDTAGNPGAQLSLLGAGYACPSNGSGGTICGTISTPTNATGTTALGIPFTRSSFTYTAPSSSAPMLKPPYTNPMLLAHSIGNPAVLSDPTFSIVPNGISGFPDVGLTGIPITVTQSFGNDSGNSKTINWTLTAGGANCSPLCGSLASQTYTRNGETVSSTITYTPPASVPVGADDQPTLTATEVDNPAVYNSSTLFNGIESGACGTGNNAILNGQYAFLLRGGAVGQGYDTFIGSFTADGNGNITGGTQDANRTTGQATGVSITSGTYSMGADNRGCVTLVNSTGGSATYRIAMGTLNGSGVATQGQMNRADDYTGNGVRVEGEVLLQNASSFNANQFSGTYGFGESGIDFSGGRIVAAGLLTSNGAGTIGSVTEDFDDNGSASGELTGGTGSYSLATNAANGRGTGAISIDGGTHNFVLYMASSSEALFMTTDTLTANTPILSGEIKLQTGPFSTSTLNNSNYVFYGTGIDQGNNDADSTVLGQIATTTNGVATITLDQSSGGTEQPEQVSSVTLSVAANGRTTIGGGSGNQPIFYFINSSSAYFVGTDNTDVFGYLQQQSGAPYSNASVSGTYFFGGNAPNIGSEFDTGTANANGSGSFTGTDDFIAAPQNGGLEPSQSVSGPYCFSSSCTTVTALGQGTLGGGGGLFGYIISPLQLVMMQAANGNGTELFVFQK